MEQPTLYDAQPPIFDPAEAQRLGEQGMRRALRAQRVQAWKPEANRWLTALESGTIVTADELIAAVGLPDIGPTRNNVVGAWFSAKAKQGHLISMNRMRKSRRPERHGNKNQVWRVA